MSDYPPVLTKRDFVQRYRAGEFGNHSPTWNTPQEFASSRYRKGLVHLRNRVAAGVTYYNLEPHYALHRWRSMGNGAGQFYCSAMAPHYANLLQGELQILPELGGLYLKYSTQQHVTMREAMLTMQTASGIMAVSILRAKLCINSYDWLQVLLRRYEGHVIEFSTFSINWGTLSNFNTVYWEVRLY